MKINKVILTCLVFVLCITTQHAKAQNRYFWLLHLKSDLRVIIHGLVSINQSGEDQSEENQTVTLHHVHSSLTGMTNSKISRPLSMDHITSHRWRDTPTKKITYRRGVHEIEKTLKKRRAMETILDAGLFFPMIFENFCYGGDYYSGVEIPSTSSTFGALIPSLCIVGQTGISFSSDSSLLGNAFNSAIKEGIQSNQCSDIQSDSDPLQYQIIHHLTDANSEKTVLIHTSLNQIHGIYIPSQNAAWLLVPHHVILALGIIPQSDEDKSLHRNPSLWFRKPFRWWF